MTSHTFKMKATALMMGLVEDLMFCAPELRERMWQRFRDRLEALLTEHLKKTP